jgi:hypothetical protein
VLLAAAYDRTSGSNARRAAGDPSIQDSIVTAAVFGNSVVGTTVSALTLGGSIRLGAGAIVGAEYATGTVSTTDSLAAAAVAVESATREWRAGVEMNVLPSVRARAGYARVTMPDSHDRITRLSGGAGYAIDQRLAVDLLVSFANSSRDVVKSTSYRLSNWSRTIALTTRVSY